MKIPTERIHVEDPIEQLKQESELQSKDIEKLNFKMIRIEELIKVQVKEQISEVKKLMNDSTKATEDKIQAEFNELKRELEKKADSDEIRAELAEVKQLIVDKNDEMSRRHQETNDKNDERLREIDGTIGVMRNKVNASLEGCDEQRGRYQTLESHLNESKEKIENVFKYFKQSLIAAPCSVITALVKKKISTEPDRTTNWFSSNYNFSSTNNQVVRSSSGSYVPVSGLNELPKEGQFYFQIRLHDRGGSHLLIGIGSQNCRYINNACSQK